MLPNALKIDSHFAAVGVQRFLPLAAFIEQQEPLSSSELVLLLGTNSPRCQGEPRQDLVKIIAAKIGDAVRCHNRVLGVAESHKRDVEGSAAEVIYEQSTLSAIPPISAVAVGKLYCGGRRLVRQPEDFETGSPRCLFGEESLVAVGVRRHPEHHLQPVRFVSPQRGALHEFVTQCRHHLCRCKAQIYPLTGNFDLAAGSRVLEPALERTHDGPTWLVV